MRTIIYLLLLLPLLAGCGGGGGGSGESGDSGDDGGTTPPPPVSIAYQGEVNDVGTSGIFNSTETNQTITVWQGDRFGEVTFRSTTLDRSFTGRDGDTFRVSRPGGSTWIFRIDYDPAVKSVSLVRPSNPIDTARWTISDPIPSGRG